MLSDELVVVVVAVDATENYLIEKVVVRGRDVYHWLVRRLSGSEICSLNLATHSLDHPHSLWTTSQP